eukprot:3203226-Pyramimonas_sp.AAC.1
MRLKARQSNAEQCKVMHGNEISAKQYEATQSIVKQWTAMQSDARQRNRTAMQSNSMQHIVM